MSGVTNSQGLVYPTATHRRCDFPQDWEEGMSALVQARIDAIQAVQDRTFPVVPAALVELTTRPVFNNTDTITNVLEFDTVVMDTDNMTNLSADPSRIYPQRRGLYQLVGHAQFRITGDPQNYFLLDLVGAGGGLTGFISLGSETDATLLDNNDNWAKYQSVVGMLAYDPETGIPLGLEATYAGGTPANGTRIDYASFGVYWWGDIP